MALNLMKAGHKLTVWNRTAAACKPLVNAGATLAASAAEVGARATPSHIFRTAHTTVSSAKDPKLC